MYEILQISINLKAIIEILKYITCLKTQLKKKICNNKSTKFVE